MESWELPSDLRQLERELAERSIPEPSADLRRRVLSGPAARAAIGSRTLATGGPDAVVVRSARDAATSRKTRRAPTLGTMVYSVSAVAVSLFAFVAWQWTFADFRGLHNGTQQAIAAEQINHTKTVRSARVSRDVVPKMVARATAVRNCVWANDGCAIARLEDIPFGRQIRLQSGTIELTYTSGLKVTLEGPAKFQVSSNGGHLTSGTLLGSLDRNGSDERCVEDLHRSLAGGNAKRTVPSFTVAVRTPTAGIVDVSTRLAFAVKVVDNGSTLVHVSRGSVGLCSMVDVAEQVVAQPYQIIKENESLKVDLVGGDRGPTTRSVAAEAGGLDLPVAKRENVE